ncbi:LOW QUALITY PROTEIN: uncharacterized protein pamr1a [Pholidichthys leucotaenia]
MGTDDGSFLIAHLFLKKLLASVRASLANSRLLEAKDYRVLAEEANRIILASRSFSVQAVRPGSEEESSEGEELMVVAGMATRRHRNGTVCFYHRHFDAEVQRCLLPCHFKKSGNGPAGTPKGGSCPSSKWNMMYCPCCEYQLIQCCCPSKGFKVGYTVPYCRNTLDQCDPCIIHPDIRCSLFENCKTCNNGTRKANDDFFVGKYCTEYRQGWSEGDCKCEFSRLSLESDHSCRYGYLQVRDGDGLSPPVIGRVCGDQLPPPIRSSGNFLHILFTSDGDNNFDGFVLTSQESSGRTNGHFVRYNFLRLPSFQFSPSLPLQVSDILVHAEFHSTPCSDKAEISESVLSVCLPKQQGGEMTVRETYAPDPRHPSSSATLSQTKPVVSDVAHCEKELPQGGALTTLIIDNTLCVISEPSSPDGPCLIVVPGIAGRRGSGTL